MSVCFCSLENEWVSWNPCLCGTLFVELTNHNFWNNSSMLNQLPFELQEAVKHFIFLCFFGGRLNVLRLGENNVLRPPTDLYYYVLQKINVNFCLSVCFVFVFFLVRSHNKISNREAKHVWSLQTLHINENFETDLIPPSVDFKI